MDKILLLPTGHLVKADEEHYSKDPEVSYFEFGVHAFDLTRFSKYKKHKEFINKIRLVENEEFIKEMSRILNEHRVEDKELISYVVETVPIDILPVYYRLFSQVSLILDSHLHPNLISSKFTVLMGLNRGGCYIINNLNDIELCCFVVRYCDTKETLELLHSSLCDVSIKRVKDILSSKKSQYAICSCKYF